MVVPIKKGTGVYSVYVEIIANGKNEEEVKGAIEDELDDIFGAENYRTYEIRELTEDEVIELDTGINNIEDMDAAYAERIGDELG